MKINITARKFKARDTLKEFIKDEVSSLERFADDIIEAEVILSFQNQKESVKIAELIVRVPEHTLTATYESEDFEPSVRKCTEKIITQLKKRKTKRIKH